MTREQEWKDLLWWQKCEVLYSLGMAWKEMAVVCGVSVNQLRTAMRQRTSPSWAEQLDRIPLPDLTRTRPREQWISRANCLNADPNWFIPKVGKPVDHRARACCLRCPVAQDCLNEVVLKIDDVSYRAFTTPRIRRGYRQYFLKRPD